MPVDRSDVIAVLKSRQPTYGDFRVFCVKLAERWSITLDTYFSASDVPLLLADLKRERLAVSPGHEDSALDLAAYSFMHEVLVGNEEFPDELINMPPRVSQAPVNNWVPAGDIGHVNSFQVGEGEDWRERLRQAAQQ